MSAQAAAVRGADGDAGKDGDRAAATASFAIWVFIGSELLFFGALFFAYAVGRLHQPAGWAVASRHTNVWLGSANTALLLSSSAAIAAAVALAEHGQRRGAARLLALTAALGAGFLAVKGVEWGVDAHEHLVPGAGFALAAVPGAEQFFALYFVATGLHALHVAIGVVGITALAFGAARGRPWFAPRRVDAMALYWHFVDVVWIGLYPLLYLVQRTG